MLFNPSGHRILIIDDEPENLRLIAAFLEQQGMDVMLASSGQEGVALAENGQPDLILLDIIMTELDGFETIELLKKNPKTETIPVLFLTALTEIEQKLKAFAVGGADCLTKPVQQEELMARVCLQLELRSLHETLKERNQGLKHALDTGNTVNVAIGVLIERHRLTMEEATEHLRQSARSQRRKMKELAAEILQGIDLINRFK